MDINRIDYRGIGNIYKEYYALSKAGTKPKAPKKSLAALTTDNMYSLKRILSEIQVVKDGDRIDFDATMFHEGMHPDVTSQKIRDILHFLHYVPRSTLVRYMKREPELGSFTPILFWAHKDRYDTPYSAWFGSKLKNALPRTLMPMMDFVSRYRKDYIWNLINTIGFAEVRKQFLTVRSTGELVSLEHHRAYPVVIGYNTLENPYPEESDKHYEWAEQLENSDECREPITISGPVAQMLLQTWLANVKYRHPAMILDPWLWDWMPPAFDLHDVVREHKPPTLGDDNDL